jgi:hypothetical protein
MPNWSPPSRPARPTSEVVFGAVAVTGGVVLAWAMLAFSRGLRSRGTPPNNGSFSSGDFIAEGPGGRTVNLDPVRHYAVGPQFFEMLGIELLHGRSFAPGDGIDTAIVGERFARILWPDADPVGQSFRVGKQRFSVVGVVREVQYPSLEARLDAPEFYVPFIDVGGSVTLNIACSARRPNDGQIRHALMTTHPVIRVGGVRPLEAQFFEQLARPRAAAALATTFAVIAVVSAAGGLFSVLTFAVGRRRKEFGVRTALGAPPAAIRRLVLRDGVWVSGAGILLGSMAAGLLAPTLASPHYEISATDPISGVVVISVLALTVLARVLASCRASRGRGSRSTAAGGIRAPTVLRSDRLPCAARYWRR